jgi:hypothetical protein
MAVLSLQARRGSCSTILCSYCWISMQYRVSTECDNPRCAVLLHFLAQRPFVAEHRIVDSAGGLPPDLLVFCSIPVGPTALHLYRSHHNAMIPLAGRTCCKCFSNYVHGAAWADRRVRQAIPRRAIIWTRTHELSLNRRCQRAQSTMISDRNAVPQQIRALIWPLSSWIFNRLGIRTRTSSSWPVVVLGRISIDNRTDRRYLVARKSSSIVARAIGIFFRC